MAMRVYALYEKSHFILSLLFIVAVGVLGFSLVRLFSQETHPTFLTLDT